VFGCFDLLLWFAPRSLAEVKFSLDEKGPIFDGAGIVNKIEGSVVWIFASNHELYGTSTLSGVVNLLLYM
jgi:hypothetical protein